MHGCMCASYKQSLTGNSIVSCVATCCQLFYCNCTLIDLKHSSKATETETNEEQEQQQ